MFSAMDELIVTGLEDTVVNIEIYYMYYYACSTDSSYWVLYPGVSVSYPGVLVSYSGVPVLYSGVPVSADQSSDQGLCS